MHHLFRPAIVAFFACLLAGPAMAGEIKVEKRPLDKTGEGNQSGIVYGTNFSFGLTAPKGWLLDNESGRRDGLDAVFYPRGSSWEHGDVTMYANTADKSCSDNETLEKLIQYDVRKYRTERKAKDIFDGKPLKTRHGKTAAVKLFLGDLRGYYEAVAYIDEETIITLLVLSTTSQADLERHMPAFRELVGSYFFVASDVKVDDSSVRMKVPRKKK